MDGAPLLLFSAEEARVAYQAWGANCGPAALAAACGLHIDDVRGKIPDFEARRYTNDYMMRWGIDALGYRVAYLPDPVRRLGDPPTFPVHGLVRIQFGGPWTMPGASANWAKCHTHWIASKSDGPDRWVFDVNGGWMTRAEWESEIIPALVAATARADGSWWPTHRWEIRINTKG